MAPALVKRYGKGTDSDATDTLIAATLKGNRGKAGGCTVDVEQTHKEDDENLVTSFVATESFASGSSETLSPSLRVENPVAIAGGASVRRLTPTECERLQAFPDGWTQLGQTADSKRYAALGDAVTVNVAEWIGRRLMQA